jgi:hypothetical protein
MNLNQNNINQNTLNLHKLSDETLLKNTQSLAQQEREILGQVLQHLREIDRRRLYSHLKFGSLYDYAIKELGYSEDQAYRRIQAMRLLKELPQIQEKINEGSLSLSHLSLAQSLFRRELKSGQKSFSAEEKMELLNKLKYTTKREAEKITVSHSTQPIPYVERVKVITGENWTEKSFEIKFAVKEEILNKVAQLKCLLAHKKPNIQLSELFELLCNLGIEKWDKTHSAPARKVVIQSKAQIKRQIWIRDKGQCQNCGSRYALEIDHRLPKAMNGDEAKENLRLLCRSCNQRAAINVFGVKKIEKYMNN